MIHRHADMPMPMPIRLTHARSSTIYLHILAQTSLNDQTHIILPSADLPPQRPFPRPIFSPQRPIFSPQRSSSYHLRPSPIRLGLGSTTYIILRPWPSILSSTTTHIILPSADHYVMTHIILPSHDNQTIDEPYTTTRQSVA